MMLSFSCFAKTYKVYVGTPPGSTSDLQARMIFDAVSKQTGDTFVILNRPGAGFVISYKAFLEDSKNNPDVILFSISSMLLPDAKIDPVNEIKGLVLLHKIHYFLVALEDSKFKTVSDIKGKLNVSITSPTSEILVTKNFPNSGLQTIPFKSENDALMSLLKKEIDLSSSNNMNAGLSSHRDKLRVIKAYPDNFFGFVGYSVPMNFPEDDKIRLNSAINKALETPEIRNWFKDIVGEYPSGGSPEQYDKMTRYVKKELETLHKNSVDTLNK